MPQTNIADDMLRVSPLNNANVPIQILLRDQPGPLNRYVEANDRAEMAVAHTNQKNSELDRIREKRAAAVASLHHLTESHRRFAKQLPKAEVEALELEIKLYDDQLRTPAAASAKIKLQPMDDVDKLVRNRRGPFDPADVPEVDALDVDDATFAEASGQVDSLYAELAKTEQMPRPKDYCKARVAAELNALAEAGKPSLDSIINPSDLNSRTGRFEAGRNEGSIRWPLQFIRPGVVDEGQVVNTLAAFVWLNRDALQAKLFAEIDARKLDGMSIEDKRDRVRELHGQIARALRFENEVLRVLESRGNYSLRKRKLHPAIILAVEWDASKIAEYTAI